MFLVFEVEMEMEMGMGMGMGRGRGREVRVVEWLMVWEGIGV